MESMSMTDVGIYTVEDLHAYREERGDMTIQLIEGELVVSPSPRAIHQVLHSRLFGTLIAAAPPELLVLSAPLDLRAGERTVVQLDLMVVDSVSREASEVSVPPVLAVEILSPSSRRTDLVRKPEVLARFGVEHYWVLDPEHPAVRVFRLVDGTFESTMVVQGEELFAVAEPFPVSFRPTNLTR